MTTTSSRMFEQEGEMNIPELQNDLRRKYRNVGNKVERLWREFTPKQREKAMRETVGDGKVIKTSRDPGLAGVRRFLPDWNLQDITTTPDFFLKRLRFRVESDLHHQLSEGVDGGPGDREVVKAGAQTIDIGASRDHFAVFLDLGKDYGRWMKANGAEGRRAMEDSLVARSGLLVPANEAHLLISRQTTTYVFYNHLIEEILDLDSESKAKSASSGKRATKEPANAMANLTLSPKPLRASIAEVIAEAVEQKTASEDYLGLLRSEPVVLNFAVNTTNSSRPELVPDDRGRILPMITDKYISVAFFEVMCNAVKVIVTWEYIVHLLRKLEGDGMNDKVKRQLVVQELSNTCHLEYGRAQSAFRRQMSRGVAEKCFRRITSGNTSRIVIKGQPADHTTSNPQLHYILRLCHPDTRHTDAAQWIQKLDDHNKRHSDDLKRLTDDQVLALGDLAIIVSFMHTLSSSMAMAAGSKKLGLLFTGRIAELDHELAQYKADADFGDHLVPSDNLLESGAASNALKALDTFLLDRSGTSLGSLYEALFHDCLSDIEQKYANTQLNLETTQKQQPQQHSYVPLPTVDKPKPASFRAEQRREKAETRPADEVEAYDITAIASSQLQVAAVPTPRLKVKSATAAVFEAIFAKGEARGPVSWTNFAGAMADLGFSVTPEYGSVYTFHHPTLTTATRAVTLHRPHASEIEGYRLLVLSRRLHRAYGWTAETFEVE